jgi:hypothetical protein
MAGTDFSAQIVSLRSGVVLDLQTTTWTTTGHRERGHVTARLTLDQALELERLIADAITTASEVPDTSQTALWGSRPRFRAGRAAA